MRLLSCILFYGATVHIGNVLGLNGQPWRETPLLWRSMDVILLLFNVAVGIGLWCKAAWAAIAFFIGLLLLQILPYSLFRQQFIQNPGDVQTLNSLIGSELLMLFGLVAFVVSRK